MSIFLASIVNTCLIDSNRNRKGTLNSCQCYGVSGTAVGRPSRMEWCFGLFGLSASESRGGKYDTKSKRRTLAELTDKEEPVACRFSNIAAAH